VKSVVWGYQAQPAIYLISNKDYGMSREVAQMAESEPRIASLLLQLVPVAQMRISQVSASYSTRKTDGKLA
jgi:hypothetical protein